jgi:hypothetical protein
MMIDERTLDRLVSKHTALATMQDLTEARQYRLKLQCKSGDAADRNEQQVIADRYDTIMMVRNDPRRAIRW